MLDLIRSRGRHGVEETYTPREVRLLRRVAAWVRGARAERLRAMEVLIEDLATAKPDRAQEGRDA
jgi:hypothetical protein